MEPKKIELKIEMPTATTNSDHSPVTMTTSISRRPAEDSALDYAYDNPAMTPATRQRQNNCIEKFFLTAVYRFNYNKNIEILSI